MPPPQTKVYSTVIRRETGELYKAFTLATDGHQAARAFTAAKVLDITKVQSVRRMEVRRKGRQIFYFNIFGTDDQGTIIVNVMEQEGPAMLGRVFLGIPTSDEDTTGGTDSYE